jgi:NAD(P)-dependent dehydrogenase (short-subunit alcohol dehydrogenase family)
MPGLAQLTGSMPTEHRIAVITGAAQGIGRQTALTLASLGYSLALNDVNSCEETSRLAIALGAKVCEFLGDVTGEAFVARFASEVEARYARVDLLVNNAGISFISPAEAVSAQDFRRVLEVNLVAPFLLSKAFGQKMLERGHGSIVNVASIAGLAAVADRSAYNASKHGLIGLTRTLAAEWGGRGVRVNAVCPGWVKTEMDHADQATGAYADQDIIDRIPMARFASPEDIARAIAFLADDSQSGFINGHALTVDGGWTTDASWNSLRLQHR